MTETELRQHVRDGKIRAAATLLGMDAETLRHDLAIAARVRECLTSRDWVRHVYPCSGPSSEALVRWLTAPVADVPAAQPRLRTPLPHTGDRHEFGLCCFGPTEGSE